MLLLRSASTTVLLTIVLVALLSSPGAAQTGSSTMTVVMTVRDLGPEGRLTPENETAIVDIETIAKFSTIGAYCLAPLRVYFSLREFPPFASGVLNPGVATVEPPGPLPGPDQTRRLKTSLILATLQDAPAFYDTTYRVKAELVAPPWSSGCTIIGSNAEGQTAIKNEFVPILEAEAAPPVAEAGFGYVDVALANRGNGPMLVSAELVPVRPLAFNHLGAGEVHLESRATKGADAVYRGTMRIDYELAGVESGSFLLRLKGEYDGAGDSPIAVVEIPLQAVAGPGAPRSDLSEDEFAALPGPGPVLLAVAVAALAWLRRRAG